MCCLVDLLHNFCKMSRLKINMDKSALFGINYSDEEVDSLVSEIGCKKKGWPIKYLGVPLGVNPRNTVFWEPIISKLTKKLATWKKSFLSREGRLTLIEAVLNALPTFYMSLLKSLGSGKRDGKDYEGFSVG